MDWVSGNEPCCRKRCGSSCRRSSNQSLPPCGTPCTDMEERIGQHALKRGRHDRQTWHYITDPLGTLGSLKMKARKLAFRVPSSVLLSGTRPVPRPALLTMPARQSANILASAWRPFIGTGALNADNAYHARIILRHMYQIV